MTLEFFRQDPIGTLLFALGPRNEEVEVSKSVQTNYPNYAMPAFYLTNAGSNSHGTTLNET